MDLRKEQQNVLDELLIKAIKKAPFKRVKVNSGDIFFIGDCKIQTMPDGIIKIYTNDFYAISTNAERSRRINKGRELLISLLAIDDIEFSFKE